MVSSTGSTPAKKATPRALSDLVGNKDNDNKEKETPAVEENPTDNVDETDNKVDKNAPTNEEVNKDNENNTVKGLTDKDKIVKDDADTDKKTGLSNSVIHSGMNKTPDELSTEPPAETAERYDIKNKVTQEDVDNPRVQVYSDTILKQVPSGTHLHPDIAKSAQNYGIAESTTDSAQVKRQITDTYHFADSAEHNDKF